MHVYVLVTTIDTGDGAATRLGKGFRKESDALLHLQNMRDEYVKDGNKRNVELYDNIEPHLQYSEGFVEFDVKIREVEVE